MKDKKPTKCCDAPNIGCSGVRLIKGKTYYVDRCWNCGKEIEEYEPEMGQAIFGNPYSGYDFDNMPDAYIVEEMLRIISYYAVGDACYSEDFKNGIFELRPYYCGDDEEEAILPNFKHYKSGLEIRWYKYIGRGMSCNKTVCPICFKAIFADCLNSLWEG